MTTARSQKTLSNPPQVLTQARSSKIEQATGFLASAQQLEAAADYGGAATQLRRAVTTAGDSAWYVLTDSNVATRSSLTVANSDIGGRAFTGAATNLSS